MSPALKSRLASAEDQARALLGQFAGDRRTLVAYSIQIAQLELMSELLAQLNPERPNEPEPRHL